MDMAGKSATSSGLIAGWRSSLARIPLGSELAMSFGPYLRAGAGEAAGRAGLRFARARATARFKPARSMPPGTR